jgi:hypothetical protein
MISAALVRHRSNLFQPVDANMTLILLEALGALLLFVAIVWWTMFSGRKGGELKHDDEPEKRD